jgi:hypothetical protein
MSITSPFFVVPLIVVVFLASILFATSSKEDGSEGDDAMRPDPKHIH